MEKLKFRKELTKEQRELLKNYGIRKGKKIYTNVNHVSKSGMMRAISSYIIVKGELCRIDHVLKELGLGNLNNRHGGITCHGCGMDMGFDLIHRLGYKVYGLKGGYAFKQEWV